MSKEVDADYAVSSGPVLRGFYESEDSEKDKNATPYERD